METDERSYVDYFLAKQNVWWRKILPVRLPYIYNVRRLCRGKILEIGCGPGRYALSLGDRIVGVDHNKLFVDIVNKNGGKAYLPENFFKSKFGGKDYFDTLLFSHILEHLSFDEAVALVLKYIQCVKSGGRIVFIVPQLAGYKTDPTHKTFFDFPLFESLVGEIKKLCYIKHLYYPFHNCFGSFFKQNELIVLCKKI